MKIMKKIFAIICFISIFCSCKKENTVIFESVSIADSIQNYTADTSLAYVIKLSYWTAKSDNALLNDSINNSFLLWLNESELLDTDKTFTLQNYSSEIQNEVKAQFTNFIKDIDQNEELKECISCKNAELRLTSDEPYQNDKLVSIVYDWYSYTGGAHGIYGTVAFNFDKKTGESINLTNLSTNIEELKRIAKEKFTEQNNDVETFWNEDKSFYLPETFYFTDNSLIFIFQVYEIAPYAAGEIEIDIDNNDIKDIIKYID